MEGSGAFILAWIICLFLWSIPLIIAEYALGKKYRMGVTGVFLKALGRKNAWMGSFVAFVSTAIAFFYAVVVGWCIYYFYLSLTQPLPGNMNEAMSGWDGFQQSAWPMLFHALALGFAAFSIWKGVRSIERINKVLIPTLLLIVIIAVIRAVTLPGAGEGIAYLFRPDWSQLNRTDTWLAALTQNAWDTGAGWGLFLTYAAYLQIKHGTVKNAFATGIGNNIVSLLSGIMIFGTVFAVLGTGMGMNNREMLEVMQTSGPASTGLTFIWMPQLFLRMPMGRLLSVLFFLGLTFAGFSSLIAMLELPTRVLLDRGMKRGRAIAIIVPLMYLLGIPSARNLNILSNQDYVWGVGLMISGGFIAIAVIRSQAERIRVELNAVQNDIAVGKWWSYDIRFFIPFAVLLLLFWWLWQSATVLAPGQWFNPLNAFSLMTCLTQWFLLILILVLSNRWLTKGMQ